MEKNITKIWGGYTNNILKEMFNNCELTHPELDNNQRMYVNTKTNFIRVGNESDWIDFDNWEAAANYANIRPGKFWVGLRPYGKQKAMAMAIINNE